MNPLLFALVDVLLLHVWSDDYATHRRERAWAHARGDSSAQFNAHLYMQGAKLLAVGGWRALWGVL